MSIDRRQPRHAEAHAWTTFPPAWRTSRVDGSPGGRLSQLLCELASGAGPVWVLAQRPFSSFSRPRFELTFRDRPDSIVLLGEERATRMHRQHLDPARQRAVDQEARRCGRSTALAGLSRRIGSKHSAKIVMGGSPLLLEPSGDDARMTDDSRPEVLWTPRPGSRSSTEIGRFLSGVERDWGLDLPEYESAWAWSCRRSRRCSGRRSGSTSTYGRAPRRRKFFPLEICPVRAGSPGPA